MIHGFASSCWILRHILGTSSLNCNMQDQTASINPAGFEKSATSPTASGCKFPPAPRWHKGLVCFFSSMPAAFSSLQQVLLSNLTVNGYNGGWPSARLFGWSAADWSRPATNKSISSERKRNSLLFCWERKSWTSWLLTCCSKKGWAAEKSSATWLSDRITVTARYRTQHIN